MQLTRVEIEGYRSINTKVDIHIERYVTVLLGPNDHGKTNILDAIEHLNSDKSFDVAVDLNWDHDDQPANYPCITFHLTLDLLERTAIAKRWDVESDGTTDGDADADGVETSPRIGLVPAELIVEVKGVYAHRTHASGEVPPAILETFAKENLPRVETIRPQESIPDAISEGNLDSESHDFMRGILYYAGLDPREVGPLFSQDGATMKQLKAASTTLNQELRDGWAQGKDLEFQLSHHSAKQEIELLISDPAVEKRFVSPSKRSSGFTHFFALKTILHARQRDHHANAYIFLFDEPGIYLHPSGQYDLLSVLDAIGSTIKCFTARTPCS